MSFEVCGMIIEHINLALWTHVWEDAALCPLLVSVGLFLLLGSNDGH